MFRLTEIMLFIMVTILNVIAIMNMHEIDELQQQMREVQAEVELIEFKNKRIIEGWE